MLRMVAEQADVLTDIEMAARLDSDSLRQEQAEKLIAAAMELRLNLLRMRLYLYVMWVYPSWTMSMPALGLQYDHLRESFIVCQQHKWQRSS
jgi:hypothetical protein